MKRNLLFFLMTMTCFDAVSQVKVPVKIDTSQHKIAEIYRFVNTYMQQDTISNQLWHPKYKNKINYNYTMDWIWSEYTPRQITRRFTITLAELQQVNDTLSYVKLMAESKPNKNGDTYSNVYKFYIVNIKGKYYLDNCKDYDSDRFKQHHTQNIQYFVSPFYQISQAQMDQASSSLDELYKQLKRPPLKKALTYYMCATEEELNNMINIVVWDGGFGGFTNIPDGYIVAINANPFYKHEFIHAILGSSANCFFLQEGIASLYGGLNKETTYEEGLKQLKACYQSGGCNFDKLYKREVFDQYHSTLIYAFAATFCKYIIAEHGLDYFYKLYDDTSFTSENFLEKISVKAGKSKEEIKKGVEKLILN